MTRWIQEQHPEEEPAQCRHGERLDEPVDDQREGQAPGFPADVLDGGKVDLDHHRVDHHPDEHGHHQVDVCVFEPGDTAVLNCTQ